MAFNHKIDEAYLRYNAAKNQVGIPMVQTSSPPPPIRHTLRGVFTSDSSFHGGYSGVVQDGEVAEANGILEERGKVEDTSVSHAPLLEGGSCHTLEKNIVNDKAALGSVSRVALEGNEVKNMAEQVQQLLPRLEHSAPSQRVKEHVSFHPFGTKNAAGERSALGSVSRAALEENEGKNVAEQMQQLFPHLEPRFSHFADGFQCVLPPKPSTTIPSTANPSSSLPHQNPSNASDTTLSSKQNTFSATCLYPSKVPCSSTSLPFNLSSSSWANLVKPKRITPIGSLNLLYHPPKYGNGSLKVRMPYSIGQQGRAKWENGLVGYFIGKKLPFTYVKNVAMNLWKEKGLVDVIGNEKGFFFFDFGANHLEGRDEVLDGGPWYFAKQPIILKKWDSRMPLDKEQPSSIPIWAKIYNVPWEYWTKEGFSILGSAIGKPLYVDKMIEDRARVSYIRMCVEVDASMPLVKEFELEMEGAEVDDIITSMVEVEYQWTPLRCGKCKVFGHDCEKIIPPPNAPMKTSIPTTLKQEWKVVSKKGKRESEEQQTSHINENSGGEAKNPSLIDVENIVASPNDANGHDRKNIGKRVEGSNHVVEAHFVSNLALKNVFEDLQIEDDMECVIAKGEMDEVNSHVDSEEDDTSSVHDHWHDVDSLKINKKGGKSSSSKKKKKKNRR